MNLHIARVLVLSSVVIASVVGCGVTRGFFAAPQDGGWITVGIGTDFTDIHRLSLPPGKYIANASAVLASGAPPGAPKFRAVVCAFTLDGAIQGDWSRGIVGGDVNNWITLPLTLGFTIKTSQVLAVACRTEVGGVYSQPSSITAIRVDHLTVQKGFQP